MNQPADIPLSTRKSTADTDAGPTAGNNAGPITGTGTDAAVVPTADQISQTVARVRERQPLVHCISAAVSMNFIADALLAGGARPMMTETATEAPALVSIANALLVNLGTLSTDGAEGIEPTVTAALDHDIPWVLDPTAIGRAPVRTPLARRLITMRPTLIRGNPSEILVLAGQGIGGRGPDTTAVPEEAVAAAHQVAAKSGCPVCVSGATDLIITENSRLALRNGSPLLAQVTGTGCVLGALSAACSAVAPPILAAVTATAWLTVAAEHAEKTSRGPGSFKTHLLDELAAISPETVANELVLP